MDIKNFYNDQHLNYEELVAYQQGALSNKEMHRLESHLIDCELCNDALEGISQIDDTVLEKHLSSIRIKTDIKSGSAITTKQWIAMAASISLIAIVGIIFYSLPTKSKLVAENLPVEDKNHNLTLDTVPSLKITSDTVTGSRVQQEILLEESDTTSKPTQQMAMFSEAKQDTIGTEGNPVAGLGAVPSVEIDSSENLITADLIFDDKDTIYQQILAESVPDLEEEQAVSRSKRMAATGGIERSTDIKDTTRSMANVADDYQPAEPRQGMRSFKRYLKRKLQYPDAAEENNIEGEVILEITVDEDGTITNIDVVQALGYGCDQEAIRLLREGPKWQPGSRKGSNVIDKVLVHIPFKP